jgi:hypothetical protein
MLTRIQLCTISWDLLSELAKVQPGGDIEASSKTVRHVREADEEKGRPEVEVRLFDPEDETEKDSI